MNNKTTKLLLVGGSGLFFLMCCLILCAGLAGYSWTRIVSATQVFPSATAEEYIVLPSSTPTVEIAAQKITPSAIPTSTGAPLESQEASLQVELTEGLETLQTLENALIPVSDLVDLAKRLKGIGNMPRTVDPPAFSYGIGDRRRFWVANVDTNENFQIEAVLQYLTEHAYFWVQDGVRFDAPDLQVLAETFENKIYPTNREFFGSEWTPGVDGDPRLYILYARGLGENLAGYFSSADEYPTLAHEYSNAVELFLLNADNIRLDEDYTFGVLAHEFQHMIHWYQDRNESGWLNEGFSELATLLNGYYSSNFDWAFLRQPDLQLNDWPNDPSATTPHYGAGFLFVTYFLDRFGEEATRLLVANPENDLASVDAVLAQLQWRDPATGNLLKAEDVFLDWVLANYIQDPSVEDGRYAYRSYSGMPAVEPTQTFDSCPVHSYQDTVKQFGADYLRFTCPGVYTLHFQGETTIGVLPQESYSGKMAFWSNKSNESDMTLTRRFDFSNYTGKLTLRYWTWFDLEKDYDYLYLLASEDGENWQILKTPSGTDEDPSGNSFGWGYNGRSGGGQTATWIQETVDLSDYAGREIYLRFEYVTDAAVNGEGFLLDDIEVPEVGYFSDFETDEGGWAAAGWVRIQNILPQTYRLALIRYGNDTDVEYLELSPSQNLEIPLKIGGEIKEVVLVVTGTTRYTRQPASYQVEILP